MIGSVEDAIIAKIKDLLGTRVRTVETVPAALDEKELQRRLRAAPAVYVTFLGGQAREETGVCLDAEFGVFFLTGGAREELRRRGDETRSSSAGIARSGGAYSLMQAVVPHLHGFVVDGAGSLDLTAVHNLFSEDLDANGVSLYSASFTVRVPIERLDADDLGDFLTLHADWIVPPHTVPPAGTPLPDAQADVSDTITLPSA